METWTIEELAERVADALAAGYPGQSNGRVREVPDRRTIRWYATIGLVDRPAAMRGRTALYGRRHLLQLVAIKRLQADGRSLAEIQDQLLGADESALERLAALPASAGATEPADAAAPVDAVPVDATPAPAAARARFWAAAPMRTAAAEPPATAAGGVDTREQTAEPVAGVVPAIRLGGVTVVLDAATRTPTPGEIDALRTAAAPLLDLLHRLDLTEGTP